MYAGYDLRQVNLYINKLFANIGNLLYREVEDEDRHSFNITGVQSMLGEKLPLREVGDALDVARKIKQIANLFVAAYARSAYDKFQYGPWVWVREIEDRDVWIGDFQ